MKNVFKRLIGLDKIEKTIADAEAKLVIAVEKTAEHQREAERARQEAEEAKLTPKEIATKKGEPWVAVLDTKVNKDNVRNGFFELDWNEEFVLQLKKAGYGFDGDPDEEIVDRWFRDLARNMFSNEGLDPNRSAGFINVNKLGNGRAEVE
jgi:hypothetical protein